MALPIQDLKAMLDQADIDTATLMSLADVFRNQLKSSFSIHDQLSPEADGIYVLETVESNARGLWHELREIVPRTKYWPVILGSYHELQHCRDNFLDATNDVDKLILAWAEVDGRTWLDKKWAEFLAKYPQEFQGALTAPWPKKIKPSRIKVYPHHPPFNTPEAVVFLGLVPTPRSWETPLYLFVGNWNDSPGPEIHTALHEYWNQNYGAEIVTLMYDRIECRVQQPPTFRRNAVTLAKEHCAYCKDIVFQGYGSIVDLASVLIHSQNWYFWWD